MAENDAVPQDAARPFRLGGHDEHVGYHQFTDDMPDGLLIAPWSYAKAS
ncbi:MAG: hypothetical protein WCG47_08550 [Dermatophilaceae bacterium]